MLPIPAEQIIFHGDRFLGELLNRKEINHKKSAPIILLSVDCIITFTNAGACYEVHFFFFKFPNFTQSFRDAR